MNGCRFSVPRFGFVLLTFGLLCGPGSAPAQTSGTNTVGVPWVGERGITETMQTITARDSEIRTGPRYNPFGARVMEPGVYPIAPDDDNDPDANPAGPTPQPMLKLGSLNFLAATASDTSGFPPDTMGTVGPTQFIIALNGRIRSFSKTTGTQDGGINVTSDSFFASVKTPGALNFTSDPRIRYDRLSGRWFIVMIDVPGNGALPNRIMFAVSDSSSIHSTSTWTFFQFQQDKVGPTNNVDTGAFADYPTLGIDANALYVGVNMFTNTSNYANTTLHVIRKSSLLAGGPMVVTPFRGLVSGGTGIFTAHAADNYDPAATEGYVIGIDRSNNGILQLLRVSTPGGTPVLSPYVNVPITPYAPALLVPHLGNTAGTNGFLDCVDQRLMAAHYRNGLLWTCHNVGVNNTGGTASPTRDGVQWFAITNIPTGLTPTVSQSGILYTNTATNTSGARFFWMGSIMVSGQGHAALGCTIASANEDTSPAVCGRFASDPPGTMQNPLVITRGVSNYNPSGDAGGRRGRRWGDYSYTSLDPSDDMTMWTIQEYCSSPNVYGVRVAKLLAPPPAAPTNCLPSIVPQGATNITLTIQGALTTNGDGYFDPGNGFSNHLGIAFSGNGITVNSLAVNDPLTLVVNISVDGTAQAGPRTVTITNPDGQSAGNANGILTISLGPTNNPPNLALIPDVTFTPGTTLAFTNVAADPDSPPQSLSFSLDAGSPTNASVDSVSGAFSWTPDATQLGTHHLTVTVTDNGTPPLSSSRTFTAYVVATNHPPSLSPVPDQTTAVGLTFMLTNSASDPDSPPNSLTFSLDPSSPFNAALDPASGIFTWSPNSGQIGTNVVGIIASDDGLPPLSATNYFNVIVLAAIQPPVLVSAVPSGTNLQLTWTATPGQTYRLQSKQSLSDPTWNELLPDVIASSTNASQSDNVSNILQRFYRVRVVH